MILQAAPLSLETAQNQGYMRGAAMQNDPA
jgi:hypothetical protein